MATNKVNIESFRTYPDGYKPSISDDQVLDLSDFTVSLPDNDPHRYRQV